MSSYHLLEYLWLPFLSVGDSWNGVRYLMGSSNFCVPTNLMISYDTVKSSKTSKLTPS
jgi:hypothetical protein